MSIVSKESIWTIGCAQWIRQMEALGWASYYMNFMFDPLQGSIDGVVFQMHRAVHKQFYSNFCLRFANHPRQKRDQERIPKLMLFPDLPAFKWGKTTPDAEVRFNCGGLHFNGPMMLPPVSRFRECPIEHIQENHSYYIGRGLTRIHIMKIDRNIRVVSAYSTKTLSCGRADPEHILILPKAVVELGETTIQFSPQQRMLKDVMSALNVSEDLARDLLLMSSTSRDIFGQIS